MSAPKRLLEPDSGAPVEEVAILSRVRPRKPDPGARKRIAERLARSLAEEPAAPAAPASGETSGRR